MIAIDPVLEARAPAEDRGIARDGVRLLVSDRRTGGVAHHTFRDLPDLLEPGDLLVVNDSATLPAALAGTRARDARPVALHLSTRIAATLWTAEPRAAVVAGDAIDLPHGAKATILAPLDPRSTRLWYVRLDTPEPVFEYLAANGSPIRYRYVDAPIPIERYQTIFARTAGSAEMPSAGRPFVAATLAALQRRGVDVTTVTLHAGVASQETHEPPYAEPYAVPHAAAAAIERTRRRGGRVVAIGTTVVRALESAVRDGRVVASAGWTELVVTPQHRLRAVDGLLTGLHEAQASHLQMLAAFANESVLANAYVAARDAGYLWHEFGDVHLIA